ncbi:MAG: MOSC domain-containing protein [Gemmobacter sp.]
MTATVAHLCRHPIKSAGFEELGSVTLTEGRAFPFDREWAVAHAAARCGPTPDAWAAKLNFLRGWGSPDLMAIACTSDEPARRVTLTHPRAAPLTVRPDDPADQPRLIDWLRPFWPATRPDPAAVVRVPGQPMTDVPDPWVAMLNLGSLRDLSARMGQELSIHRWRGNIWLDGLAPWAEFGLVGQEMDIGTARLRIETRITRCRATEVNPATGQSDAPTLAALETGFGHTDFGVYARVIRGGTLALGDSLAQ